MKATLLLSLISAVFAASNEVKVEFFNIPDCAIDPSYEETIDVETYCNGYDKKSFNVVCNDNKEVVVQYFNDTNCDDKADSTEVIYQTGECKNFVNTPWWFRASSQRYTCTEDDDDPCFARDTTFVCRLSNPSLNAYTAFEACFADGPVAGAERVRMASLRAGDLVLSEKNGGPSTTSVIVNQHASVSKASNLIHLHHARGTLSLTADHMLYLNGHYAAARAAVQGDLLSNAFLADVQIERITHSRGAIVNPITADGKILAASAQGTPVLAATGNEWLADVLLSAYPKYTLSFSLAAAFPQTVQAYYDVVLEPFFTAAVPYLAMLKAAVPAPVVAVALVVGDTVLALGLLAFALCSLNVLIALSAVAVVTKSFSPRRVRPDGAGACGARTGGR